MSNYKRFRGEIESYLNEEADRYIAEMESPEYRFLESNWKRTKHNQ